MNDKIKGFIPNNINTEQEGLEKCGLSKNGNTELFISVPDQSNRMEVKKFTIVKFTECIKIKVATQNT